MKQRIGDLFDFPANFDPKKDRSGSIGGSVLEEMDYQNIGGNKSKSFLRQGVDSLTEINLNITEKLWDDYRFEGQIFLRRTDDIRIETRKDVRLKDVNFKILNEENLVEFGDFYGDFSPFVLSNSLEGFHADVQPVKGQKLQAVAARRYESDSTAGLFQRNVAGGKYDVNLFPDSRLFNTFRIGAQAVNSRDNKGSLEDSFTATGQRIKVLENTVYGIDGDIALRKYLSVNYEIAQSAAIPDVKSPSGEDHEQHGMALRVQPTLRFDKVGLRYLFNYVQPKFYTDIGSAIADRMAHQFNLNVNLFSWLGFNLTENLYYNHLSGSTQTRRSNNNDQYMSVSIKPLPKRQSLSLRPYVNLLHTDTDDTGNLGENRTQTIGLALDDSFGSAGFYSLFYENRQFVDEATKTGNDYFQRFGLSFGTDARIAGKRVYGSISPSVDLHKSKQVLDNKEDVTFNLPFNLQIDLLSWCTFRSAYNLMENDGAKPLTNFENQRFYAEGDFLINKTRDLHLILRGERNVFYHEDVTQRFNETRLVVKLLSQF